MSSFCLDWRASCSVLFALGLLAPGCAEGAVSPQTQSEGSAHGDDGGASDDDTADDDEAASDDESDTDDDAPTSDDDAPSDDGQPELDAGGDGSSEDGWDPTDSSDDGETDGPTDDGSDADAAVPDGCMVLAPNSPSANFGTVDAVCFSVAAQPATAWEVYRLGNRTITVDGTTVTAGQLPWPGSAPFVVEFSAGSDATTAWAYW
jgi:hypothetical protein